MLRPLKTIDKAIKEVDEIVKEIIKDAEKIFIQIGDQAMLNIERNRGYENQSGNLSDSRGFAIANNGRVIYVSRFPSSDGGNKGRSLAIERASQQVSGLGIVVVAGEDYAEYIEDMGYNVIASGEIYVRKVVPRLMNELGLKSRKRK